MNTSGDKLVQAIVQTKQMRIYPLHNLKPRTNLGGILGKNPVDELVRLMREIAKLVIKTSSKVREPKIYDKAISDTIYGNKWREAINEELWNLNSH